MFHPFALAELLRLKSSCSPRHERVDMSHAFNPNRKARQDRDPSFYARDGFPYADGLHAYPCAIVFSSRYFTGPFLTCRHGHAGHGGRPPSCRGGTGQR